MPSLAWRVFMNGKINRISQILLVLSSIALGLVFFFPLWEISLWAPQYPEGLGLKIWLTKMTGDLHNINILNHYIGMAKIEPESIPELKIFIYLFGVLAALALAAAAIGKRIFLHFYTVLFLAFSLGALYDFYAWEYKYGHELNPEAAIKMEGESYQPPLIGTKTLMNIEASSWPDIGGFAHIVALTLTVGASVYEFRRSKKERA